MSRPNALGKGGKAGLVKPAAIVAPVKPREALAVPDAVEPEVLGPVLTEQRLYELALDRVYAIPREDQTVEMVELLESVCDRLDQLACIGKYEGQLPPRNATAVHNAWKTRIILTLGPQEQRSQKATVSESHTEIVVTHIKAGAGKPN